MPPVSGFSGAMLAFLCTYSHSSPRIIEAKRSFRLHCLVLRLQKWERHTVNSLENGQLKPNTGYRSEAHISNSNWNRLGFGPRPPGQLQTVGWETMKIRTNLLVKRETDITNELLTQKKKSLRSNFWKQPYREFMHIYEKNKKNKIK